MDRDPTVHEKLGENQTTFTLYLKKEVSLWIIAEFMMVLSAL